MQVPCNYLVGVNIIGKLPSNFGYNKNMKEYENNTNTLKNTLDRLVSTGGIYEAIKDEKASKASNDLSGLVLINYQKEKYGL